MAIYHLSVKPISRGAGRSATAAAAYRAADIVRDVSAEETYDYTRKRGVEHDEIVLPTAAAARDINWARDRQALWNAAEAAENRSNSRVAREYEIALPHELNKAQRLELVREFASEIANRHGVAVDFAIHAPHRFGDGRNWHAHLMATTRTIEAEGLGDKVSIEWSDGNRRKAGLTPAKEEISAIRERWAAITNEHLKALDLEIRIDHRSLEAQGIERVPTVHLGPAVNGMERRGEDTQVGERIEKERAAEAAKSLERAAELVQVQAEQQSLKVSMLDLSAALEAARRERDLGRDLEPKSVDQSAERTKEKAPAKSAAERAIEKVQERARELGEHEARTKAPGKKRGMFEGLKLQSPGPLATPAEREATPQPTQRTPERSVQQVRALALEQSIDRYARAWMDAWRMHEKDLPILEHQKTEIRVSGEALDRERPGTTRDLINALRYEPPMHRAMHELEGPERTRRLLAGLKHEEEIRRDPNLRAERLVKEWNGLEAQRKDLAGSRNEEARERVKGQMRELAMEFKLQPQLELALKSRARELGIEPGSRLGRVLDERNLERALSITERERTRDLGLSR